MIECSQKVKTFLEALWCLLFFSFVKHNLVTGVNVSNSGIKTVFFSSSEIGKITEDQLNIDNPVLALCPG